MNTLLKSIFLMGSLTAAALTAQVMAKAQKNPAYATFNDTYYSKGKLIDKYMGDVVAVKGKVVDEKPGPGNKPIIQIQLEGEKLPKIWVASLVKMLPNTLKKGDTISVLGYFDETAKETSYMAKLASRPEYVLGFCFEVESSGLPIYYTKWMHRCVQWENGEPFREKTVQATKK